jgi:hypothetical protein
MGKQYLSHLVAALDSERSGQSAIRDSLPTGRRVTLPEDILARSQCSSDSKRSLNCRTQDFNNGHRTIV